MTLKVFKDCMPKSPTKLEYIRYAMDTLTKLNIPFSTKNGGVHIVVEPGNMPVIDLWPSTGMWRMRETEKFPRTVHEMRGLRHMLKFIGEYQK